MIGVLLLKKQLDIQGISAVGIDIYGLSSDAEVLWHVCDVLDDFLQNLTAGCFQTKYVLESDDSILKVFHLLTKWQRVINLIHTSKLLQQHESYLVL
jgi:hypothetical protein